MRLRNEPRFGRDRFLDGIGIDRTFTIGGRPVTFFAGAQNLTNRENFASLGWNRTRNMAEINEQNGIFPLVGFDWPF